MTLGDNYSDWFGNVKGVIFQRIRYQFKEVCEIEERPINVDEPQNIAWAIQLSEQIRQSRVKKVKIG